MKFLFYKIISRLGAFISVMFVCYGIVVAGAWHSSGITPKLHVSLPSFSVATPIKIDLHAKKQDTCRLTAESGKKPDACDTSKLCGRHDCDSNDATSLYCGCHSHGDSHAGSTVGSAPYMLPSTMEKRAAVIAESSFPGRPSLREIVLVVKIERPPSSLLV